jgi:hypothetical protein
MSGRLTMPAQDGGDGLFKLGDVLRGTVIEGILNHGLLGTGSAPKGALEHRVAAQTRGDLDQAVRASQEGQEGIGEFLTWAVFDGLLSDGDRLANWREEVETAKLDAKGGQAGA